MVYFLLLIVASLAFAIVGAAPELAEALVTTALHAACDPSPPAGQGLVGWWTFEKPGEAACDESGSGNHGVVVGAPARVPGRFGPALRFDGVDDAIWVPDRPSLDARTLTAMAWVRPEAASAEEVFLSRNTYSNVEGWAVWFDHGGNPAPRGVAVHYSYPGVNLLATTPGALPDDTWTHVAFTYDGAAFAVYRDGVLVGERPWPGGIGASFDDAVRIGTTNGGASDGNPFFHGVLDEVKIYGRVLLPGEIACEAEANRPAC